MISNKAPIVIDGPNFINRVLEMHIDKDIISRQLSLKDFRCRVTEWLKAEEELITIPFVEFVCSKKLFGSGTQKFTKEEREFLINRLSKEKGVHIEEVDIPGSTEKGVDTTVSSKMEILAKNYESIILVSSDTDYIPNLKKLREQGTKIFLVQMSKNISEKLVNEAYLTIDLHNEYECLFEYNYPKYWIYKDFTKEDFREIISQADDRKINQLRVRRNGLVYMSHENTGNQNIWGLQFRFESTAAFNEYVGPRAASKADFIEDEYNELMLAWKYKNKVDDYIDMSVRFFLDEGDI